MIGVYVVGVCLCLYAHTLFLVCVYCLVLCVLAFVEEFVPKQNRALPKKSTKPRALMNLSVVLNHPWKVVNIANILHAHIYHKHDFD